MINMCDIYEGLFDLLATKIGSLLKQRPISKTEDNYELQLELTKNY